MMTCKNCGASLKDTFCGNCRQKSQTQKVNAIYVLQEIPNSILQVDRRFFSTQKNFLLGQGTP